MSHSPYTLLTLPSPGSNSVGLQSRESKVFYGFIWIIFLIFKVGIRDRVPFPAFSYSVCTKVFDCNIGSSLNTDHHFSGKYFNIYRRLPCH